MGDGALLLGDEASIRPRVTDLEDQSSYWGDPKLAVPQNAHNKCEKSLTVGYMGTGPSVLKGETDERPDDHPRAEGDAAPQPDPARH